MHIAEKMRRYSARKWIRYGLTTAIVGALFFVLIFTYDFLAINDPLRQGILVVEAWIPAQTLTECVNAFDSGHYSYLVVVGGPIGPSFREFNDRTTYADLAAKRFEKLGFDTTKLVTLRVSDVSVGHTLAEAAAVKRWLDGSRISVCCVDVFSLGPHARKSRIVFRYALDGHYRVGIISGRDFSYRPKLWFFSRVGMRKVVRNLAGYLVYKVWISIKAEASRSDRQGFQLRAKLRRGMPSSVFPLEANTRTGPGTTRPRLSQTLELLDHNTKKRKAIQVSRGNRCENKAAILAPTRPTQSVERVFSFRPSASSRLEPPAAARLHLCAKPYCTASLSICIA